MYELKIGAVMTRDVRTVVPDMKMKDLRSVLRDHRIAGAPVVKQNKLIGIISVEDFIDWLSDGAKDCKVGEKMTRDVFTLYDDEPLIYAIRNLDHFGFGRFPVINRKTGTLVGIVTKGDVIEGLLHELETSHLEVEKETTPSEQFFDIFLADRTRLTFQYHIIGKTIEQGGEVASSLKKTLNRMDLNPIAVRNVSVSTYEAEMNVIIYADEGTITVTIEPDKISIDVKDSGPGIPDIEKAMQSGYSTAPNWVRELGFGAGIGLNNIRNCSNSFKITSVVGKGTRLKFSISMATICN